MTGERIVQPEIARARQAEDRKVGEFTGGKHAEVGKAKHAGPVDGGPPHHLLDGGGVGALGGAVGVPGAVHLADHVGGFVRRRAVDRERHRSAQRRDRYRASR